MFRMRRNALQAVRLQVPRGGEQVSSMLGYSNGERKPTAADRLADAVQALIDGGPHLFYLQTDKQYKHSHSECQATLNRLIKALAEAKEESK